MAEHKSLELHIAMFPWLAVGHITPFLHLSNELAKRGHRITFLLPKKAQIQLQHLNLHPNLITFHPLTIPHFDGLPHGTETASDIPIHLTHLLAVAMDRTRDQVENFLRATIPDMVFYDNAHWIPEITRQLGIKAVCNNVVSAAALSIALVPARVVPKGRAITEEELEDPPPGYPSSTIVLRAHEARALSFIALPFGDGITFYDRVITAMKESDVISIRTCKEIEGNLCDYMANQFGKSVFNQTSVTRAC
jgi:anthocyanidin 3-O-glucoside 2'''-O-xylosyltransferase